ncbi:MAG: hypothetical protein RL637_482, partial [Pseudomonadota bacterium]
MSIQAIQKFHNEIEAIKVFSGETKEQSTKSIFLNLLNHYCKKNNLLIVSEISIKSKKGTVIRPDGIIKNNLRLNCGYWESKANVDLNQEIDKKINAGYPLTNTLFQDNETAILYQDDKLLLKVSLNDYAEFDKLLQRFVDYETKEIKDFNKAIEKFKQDLPDILIALRERINQQEKTNDKFVHSRNNLFKICQNAINPEIKLLEINEMLLQHILTEEIFTSIFSNAQFHQENNIAKELYKVENTFFTGSTKRNTLADIQHYYSVIKIYANQITNHHDKQDFLKAIYENFYKAYNPKAADKMGIVYTPTEIVKFQIKSVDYLLAKHFKKKTLITQNVKILDPCTGTGTYICELIDYLPKKYLPYKFKNDIYANELGLLPYYIANLNIEYTYQQRMGNYVEFEHICWVDTLDITNFINAPYPEQMTLEGISEENTKRIEKQNKEEISVIIGNPPYNANQMNENENNKNRQYFARDENGKILNYGGVDGQIKNTYIKYSTAQKTKQYDMYKRFIRWASDRIEQNGIICFIVNRSFIDKKQDDGFRKSVLQEFDFCYIVDLGGDMRLNTDSNDNVFGITIGVAILFLIKKSNHSKQSELYYFRFTNCKNKEEKLNLLHFAEFEELDFDKIIPDDKENWINQTDNDFESFLALYDKNNQETIFNLATLGVSTNRDDWVYDFSEKNLLAKIKYFITNYNQFIKDKDYSWNICIKWSRDLKDKFNQGKKIKYNKNLITLSNYRPFVKKYWYYENILTDRFTKNHISMFGNKLNKYNQQIMIRCITAENLVVLANQNITDLNYLKMGNGGTFCFPLYLYDTKDNLQENITDWALNQFKNYYENSEYRLKSVIQKIDIFHYVYAVLHNPHYRTKYELNLK